MGHKHILHRLERRIPKSPDKGLRDGVLQKDFRRIRIYSGRSWYSTLDGFEGLVGARNTRSSLSLLHADFEFFILVM